MHNRRHVPLPIALAAILITIVLGFALAGCAKTQGTASGYTVPKQYSSVPPTVSFQLPNATLYGVVFPDGLRCVYTRNSVAYSAPVALSCTYPPIPPKPCMH